MSFLDQAKKKLGDTVDKHGEKISSGLDTAARKLDAKTEGKYSTQIQTGVGKTKQALDDFDNRGADPRATSGGSQPPAPSEDPPGGPSTDPSGPTGPTGPSDPAEPTEPTEPTAPTGPMSGGDPDPVPTDPSPVPPEPGADPNEEIATGGRPVPSGSARG